MISVRVCTTSVVWLMLWLTHLIICYSEVTHILTTFHNIISIFRVKSKRKSIPRCLTTPTSKFLTFSQVLCQFIVAYYTWFLVLLPPHCLSHNRHCKYRVKSKRRCISRLHVSLLSDSTVSSVPSNIL